MLLLHVVEYIVCSLLEKPLQEILVESCQLAFFAFEALLALDAEHMALQASFLNSSLSVTLRCPQMIEIKSAEEQTRHGERGLGFRGSVYWLVAFAALRLCCQSTRNIPGASFRPSLLCTVSLLP